jgi:hypothetical protein
MRDCCVQCRNETIYDFTDHIDMRYGYVEGVGQFCISCFTENTRTIQIPVRLIRETPNDIELGNAVRKLLWENGD